MTATFMPFFCAATNVAYGPVQWRSVMEVNTKMWNDMQDRLAKLEARVPVESLAAVANTARTEVISARTTVPASACDAQCVGTCAKHTNSDGYRWLHAKDPSCPEWQCSHGGSAHKAQPKQPKQPMQPMQPQVTATVAADRLRPEVRAFAQAMERKLRVHDAKRGTGKWRSDDPRDLMRHLRDEVDELAEVADPTFTLTTNILDKAADVGNMAMMIADACVALPAPAPIVLTEEERDAVGCIGQGFWSDTIRALLKRLGVEVKP